MRQIYQHSNPIISMELPAVLIAELRKTAKANGRSRGQEVARHIAATFEHQEALLETLIALRAALDKAWRTDG